MFTPRTPNVRIDMSRDPGQIHRPPRLAPLAPTPAQPGQPDAAKGGSPQQQPSPPAGA